MPEVTIGASEAALDTSRAGGTSRASPRGSAPSTMYRLVSVLLLGWLVLGTACTPGSQAQLPLPPGQSFPTTASPQPTPIASAPRVAAPTPRATPVQTRVVSRATPASASLPPTSARALPVLDTIFGPVLPSIGQHTYAILLEDLASGAQLLMNEQQVLPSASVYKLAVAWEVLREVDAGTLSLDAPLEILDEDAVEPEPDGGVGVGDTPTLGEALGVMLTSSSNAAAHAVLRTLGRSEFNTMLRRDGLSQTHVPEPDATGAAAADTDQAVTTATDIAHLLRLVATGQGLSTTAEQALRGLLASGGPPDALRDSLPADEVGILDKTGNLDDASNVGALLQSSRSSVILVVLDQGVDPGDARNVIAQLGRGAYEAFLQPE